MLSRVNAVTLIGTLLKGCAWRVAVTTISPRGESDSAVAAWASCDGGGPAAASLGFAAAPVASATAPSELATSNVDRCNLHEIKDMFELPVFIERFRKGTQRTRPHGFYYPCVADAFLEHLPSRQHVNVRKVAQEDD
jgi:hypothetical protein